jgi:iron-sulfur cluster repair protein YtfE (RIC family)
LDLALDTRTGLPQDLRFLLERYPREVWPGHANLGAMAQFWLQRHDMFRELGGALQTATTEFREGRAGVEAFQRWFAPRLQFFLSQLHTHHQIEDFHYFPVFTAAEERLKSGFEVLDSDHKVIHDAILASVESANAFLQSMGGDADKLRHAGDRYADVNDQLLKQLLRHLNDEEDLIVPLILDRGEATLGVY